MMHESDVESCLNVLYQLSSISMSNELNKINLFEAHLFRKKIYQFMYFYLSFKNIIIISNHASLVRQIKELLFMIK